jgi:hypothetical protein
LPDDDARELAAGADPSGGAALHAGRKSLLTHRNGRWYPATVTAIKMAAEKGGEADNV